MFAEENTDVTPTINTKFFCGNGWGKKNSTSHLEDGCKNRSFLGGRLCRVAPAAGREDVLVGRWRRAGSGFPKPAKSQITNFRHAGKRS